jgi:hypothetical protein
LRLALVRQSERDLASRRSRICPSSHAVTPCVRAVAPLHPSAVAQSPRPSKTARLRPFRRFSPCLSRPPGAVGGACGLGCANGAPQGNDRYGSWLGCDSPFPCIHEPFRRHRHSITRHRESQRQIRSRARASDACLLLAQFVPRMRACRTRFVPGLCTALDTIRLLTVLVRRHRSSLRVLREHVSKHLFGSASGGPLRSDCAAAHRVGATRQALSDPRPAFVAVWPR